VLPSSHTLEESESAILAHLGDGAIVTPFHRLRGFDAAASLIIDAMHVLGGVLKDAFRQFQGIDESIRVNMYELEINNRAFDGKHLASKLSSYNRYGFRDR
jgi:hypothetical protein